MWRLTWQGVETHLARGGDSLGKKMLCNLYYFKKAVSQAINSNVGTGTDPCINNAIYVVFTHGFAVLRISILGASRKLTSSSVTWPVANVISCRQDDVSLCPGSGVFKTFAGNVLFRAIIGTGKKNFSKQFLQSFRATKCFYAIIAIKYAFLVH